MGSENTQGRGPSRAVTNGLADGRIQKGLEDASKTTVGRATPPRLRRSASASKASSPRLPNPRENRETGGRARSNLFPRPADRPTHGPPSAARRVPASPPPAPAPGAPPTPRAGLLRANASRIDEEGGGGGPDTGVRLRDPVAGPLRAQPDARLHLRPPVANPRRADPDAREHDLRAPAPKARQARPDCRDEGGGGREGELPPRLAAAGEGGVREGEPPPGRRGRPRRVGGAQPRRDSRGHAGWRPALRARQALRRLFGPPQRAAQAQAGIPVLPRGVRARGLGGCRGDGQGPMCRRRAVQAPCRQEGLHRQRRRVREEVCASSRLCGGPWRRLGAEVLSQEQQGDEEGFGRVRRRFCGYQGEEGHPQVVGSPVLRVVF